MAKWLAQVQLFAALREAIGVATLELELPDGCTVAHLRQELLRRWPQVHSLLQRCAIAVNQHYAAEHQLLSPGDEIALIPPVSGG